MLATNDKTVTKIRDAYTRGDTLLSIATKYEVSVSTVVRHTADLPARRATKGKPRAS